MRMPGAVVATVASPKASRVALMLFWMYGVSNDFSLGLTRRDWISAGKIPPTTTDTTSSRTTPTIGRRQDLVQMTERNISAHMIEAMARIALVGSTALASVYWMPVIRSVDLVVRE